MRLPRLSGATFLTVKAYSEIATVANEAQVYVDLGYAHENDGNPDKALENTRSD
jgi:hypothetical protein